MKDYLKKSRRFIALVLSVLVTVSMLPVQNVQAAAATKFNVTGTITDSSTKKGVGGVSVVLKQGTKDVKKVTTAATGKYTFTGVTKGAGYTVNATATGYKAGKTTTFTLNAPATKNIALAPLVYTVKGTVKESGTNKAIVGATVVLKQGTKTIATKKTVTGGAYTIPNVKYGTGYTMQVTATGYTAKPVASFAVKRNETKAVVLTKVKTAITAVAISDTTPTVGDTLTAKVTPTTATGTYSWKVGGVQKGTAKTYKVAATDVGKTITLTVVGNANFSGTKTSAATAKVVAATTAITAVTISNTTPAVDDVLTAKVTPTAATVKHSWKVDGVEKATTDTYKVVTTDIGKKITVTVTGTGSYSGAKTSAATAEVKANETSTAALEAAKITATALGTITVGDAKSVMQKAQDLVEAGYTVTVKSTSAASTISAAGVALAAGTADVVFTVTKGTDTADTAAIAITVNAAASTAALEAAKITATALGTITVGDAKSVMQKAQDLVEVGYIVTVKSTSAATTINAEGVALAAGTADVVFTVTKGTDTADTTAITLTVGAATTTATLEAAKITATTLGTITVGDTTTILAKAQALVGTEYNVTVKSSSDETKISTAGVALAAGTSNVVFAVTNKTTATDTADTAALALTVTAASTTAALEAAKITATAIGTIAVGDTTTVLAKAQALVATGYTVTVKSSTDETKISAAGVALAAGTASVVFKVTNATTATDTADTAAIALTVNTVPASAASEALKITANGIGVITVGDTETVVAKAQKLVAEGFTVTIKSTDESKITKAGVATAAGTATTIFTVTKGTDVADSSTIALTVNAATTAIAEAAKITAAAIGTITLGETDTVLAKVQKLVAPGYTVAVKSSTDLTIINANGVALTAGTTTVVFSVSKGVTSADSISMSLTVNSTAAIEMAKITAAAIDTITVGDTVLAKAQSLVATGYVVTIKTTSDATKISALGSALAAGTSDVVFTVTKGTDTASTAAITLTVNSSTLEVVSVGISKNTSIVVTFNAAPKATLTASDFVVKSDSQSTPTTVKTISAVSESTDKKSYTLTVSSITDGHYFSLSAGATNKFTVPATIVPTKYSSAYSVKAIDMPDATTLVATLTTGITTALTNDNIKNFVVTYAKDEPTASTIVVTPTALAHQPLLSADKVILTVPTLANTAGKVTVNNFEATIDFMASVITEDTLVRTTATTATLNFKSSDATGKYRYILDKTGTATAPAMADFDVLVADSGKAVEGSYSNKAGTVDLTALNADVAAKLYVVYTDAKDSTFAKSNKTSMFTYTLSTTIQAPAPLRTVVAGTVAGTFATGGTNTNPAYITVTTIPDTIPSVGAPMPTTGGTAVAALADLPNTAGMMGRYVNIYEAKGVSATDSLLVGAFKSVKLDFTHFPTPTQPDVKLSQMVSKGKDVELNTTITTAQLSGHELYASAATDKTTFTIAGAYKMTYSATAAFATLPSVIADGTYGLFLVNVASGAVSAKSTNTFTVDSTAPVITLIDNSFKRASNTAAELQVSVNENIAVSGTGKWGIVGKLDPTAYVAPTADVTNAAIIKDLAYTIIISGTAITTGHGTGISALTEGKKYLTVQAIDQAGNKSNVLNVSVDPFQAPIPTGSYTIATASATTTTDATNLASGQIRLQSNGTTIKAASTVTGVLVNAEYTLTAPNYATVMKLMGSGALTTNDTFALTNFKVSSITKASTSSDSIITGLQKTDIDTALTLNGSTSKTLTVKGDLGDKDVTINGTSGNLYDIINLTTTGDVTMTAASGAKIKASNNLAITTNDDCSVIINNVSFNGGTTGGDDSIVVKAVSETSLAVTNSTNAVAIVAQTGMETTTVDFTGQASQSADVTVTGLDVPAAGASAAKALKINMANSISDLIVAGGVVDVTGVSIPAPKTIKVNAATKAAKVTAGTRNVTTEGANTNAIELVSAGNVTVNTSAVTTEISGSINALTMVGSGKAKALNTTVIQGKVTVPTGFKGNLDLSPIVVGGVIEINDMLDGTVTLNPGNTFKYGTAQLFVGGATTGTFGSELTTNGVKVSAGSTGVITVTGTTTTATPTATFYLGTASSFASGVKFQVDFKKENNTDKVVISSVLDTTIASSLSVSKSNAASVSMSVSASEYESKSSAASVSSASVSISASEVESKSLAASISISTSASNAPSIASSESKNESMSKSNSNVASSLLSQGLSKSASRVESESNSRSTHAVSIASISNSKSIHAESIASMSASTSQSASKAVITSISQSESQSMSMSWSNAIN